MSRTKPGRSRLDLGLFPGTPPEPLEHETGLPASREPGPEAFIVTIKYPHRDPDHDPRDRKTGQCEFSPVCTDVTGEHHSFIEYGPGAEQVTEAVRRLGYHVTRVEAVAYLPREELREH